MVMNWTRGPMLGHGSTATVYLAAFPDETVAVKSAELSRSIFLQKEQSFLSKLNSPNVVKYLGCDVTFEHDQPTYNIFMEYVSSGTISDAIRRNGKQLEEGVIKAYMYQILQGLEYLHSNGLAHCDIKSQNILVCEKSGKVKIADLGCAKLVHEDSLTSSFSGTPLFMAPEVARGEEQGFEGDIWAVGCVMIEMATGGSSPWTELSNPVSALYRIGFSGDLPEFPRWLSKEGKDFLSKCLTRDIKERWTAKMLLEHPFVKESYSLKDSLISLRSSTPISVLDQDQWDSFEEGPQIDQSICSSSSPQERIRVLRDCCAFSDAPSWEFDENWCNVRSNGDEDSQVLLESNNVIVMEATVASDVDIIDEEFHSPMCDDYDEELEFEWFVGFDSRIGSEGDFRISNIVTDDSFVTNLEIEQDTSFIQSHSYSSCQIEGLSFLLLMSSLFCVGFRAMLLDCYKSRPIASLVTTEKYQIVTYKRAHCGTKSSTVI